MNRKFLLVALAGLLLIVLVVAILFTPKSSSENAYTYEILVENLDIPWAMDFLPNETMIFTQRGGKVSTLNQQNVKTVGKINVTANGESGLLGVAVDPQFSQNRYIYLYYTYAGGNRVSRFVLNEQLENETVILDKIPAASIHDGGRIKFGQDGKLYATTGDASNKSSAQDINSLGGKILRINKDGSVPSENPFKNYVYSYGHRNPQGLVWDSNGILYESEHGQTRNDEINIIKPGINYGWPTYEGNSTASGYQAPFVYYADFTLAPSGIAFHQNSLYVAGLRGSQIRKISLSNNGTSVIGQETLFTQFGRIRDSVEHNGYIYICTSNRDGRGVPQAGDDKIIRIKVN